MGKFAKEILPINIEDEMKQSYLDYAMSVIVGRALPDVRDGLKPVHRRSLYAMSEMGNVWNKPYKKAARIVGSVLGLYHPHGDSSVYDTIVRMAQPFSLRYPLVDGQGNFGCFTGDTKIKLVDGTEKSFAELAQLPAEEVFYVYSVNEVGKIVVGEGKHARITRKNAELLELTLDNGETVRCTPDHRFMLRDGRYKEAQDLIPEDSLMPGYFDTHPIKEGLNEYLRVFQPDTSEYEFVHRLADEFNVRQENPAMMRELTQKASIALHENWKDPNYKARIMRQKIAGYVHRLIQTFTDQAITPTLYESERKQNWIPTLHKALEYFNDFESLVKAGHNYNHRIIAKQWLTETADTYDITVNVHHNFLLTAGVFVHNSIDGDAPSAMRYTEVRMSKIAHELLMDIDKETVNFVPNYDGAEQEPTVLPTRIPNLLINGSSGIAVGMATNIPPHNLREVIDACLALIDKPNLPVEALMVYIPGPDFPTAAIINGSDGIIDGYRTGRGRVLMRARTHTEEEKGGREKLVVTELPYQVNKARLIEKIADLVKERKLEGIAELRDESDKDGIRVVLELRRGEVADVILNNLYQHTQLQTAFGINMVALVDGQPRLLNLKETLIYFIQHRQEVVTRRTLFELRKARERVHILEGLAVALSSIDPIIALIKAAKNSQEARLKLLAQPLPAGLVTALLKEATASDSRPEDLALDLGLTEQGDYRLSETQAQAILELRLHRLTGLEQDKILEEYRGLLVQIQALLDILGSHERLMQVIREELLAIRKEYGDERRTQILADHKNLNIEDLITEEEVLVTLSRQGYIKAQVIESYTAQRRGGKGKIATQMKEEDFIDQLFIANTHETILCFTNWGKVYWLKVYELPQAARTARGKPIVNLLPLEDGERINAILPIPNFSEDRFVFMATARGTVKKTALIEFSRPRASGIIALALEEDDLLIGVDITDGQQDVMLFSKKGKAVRFNESGVRSVGRTARGVRGIKLAPEDKVISLIITYAGGTILTATVNGFGKRTPVEDYPVKGRGTQGVITIKTSERNGEVVGAIQVKEDDDIMLISNRGTLVRTSVKGITEVSRNTQGVNLISLGEGEQLVAIERVEDIEDIDGV